MTDEERAREIARIIGGIDDHARFQIETAILQSYAAIRAHEREWCAQVAEAAHIRVLMKSDKLAKGYNTAALDIAAAIRARGGKT